MDVARDTEELIHLYADGELSFDRHSELFAHLASSEEARRLLESIMQFRRLSRQETFIVPPAMDAAFMQRLARQRQFPRRADRLPARGSFWQRRTRVSLRTAALLGAGLILLGLWGARPSPQQPPRPVTVVQRAEESPVVMSAHYVFSPGVVVEAER